MAWSNNIDFYIIFAYKTTRFHTLVIRALILIGMTAETQSPSFGIFGSYKSLQSKNAKQS